MAVATPVYERSTTKEDYADLAFGSQMTADEIHNASIKNIYAKIINPEYKLSDIVSEIEKTQQGQPVEQAQPAVQPVTRPAVQAVAQPKAQPAVQPKPAVYAAPAAKVNTQEPVYLVQGARADSDLFRADSEINRAYLAQYRAEAAPQPVYAPDYTQAVQQTHVAEEEESEEVRPTRATRQYRTLDANGARIGDSALNSYREGEIPRPEEDMDTHSKLSFTKMDKIILGVVLSLILSVFVLIIVNSAIISNINSDLASLDEQLVTAQQGLEQSLEELEEATAYENVYQYAVDNGIIG